MCWFLCLLWPYIQYFLLSNFLPMDISFSLYSYMSLLRFFLFLVLLWPTVTLFRLKILFNLCSLWRCLSIKFRNTRPMLVDTLLLYEGLYQMMLRLRFLDGLFSLILLCFNWGRADEAGDGSALCQLCWWR